MLWVVATKGSKTVTTSALFGLRLAAPHRAQTRRGLPCPGARVSQKPDALWCSLSLECPCGRLRCFGMVSVLRGGENGTGRMPDLATMSARRGMLRVPAKGGRPIRLHVLLHLGCAPRQSSDTEGTQRPGALLLRAGGFPSYSFGSRRVRAAIKEPSQP